MKQLVINKSITNRRIESLDKYLQEVAKESLLTADEEVDLAKKIKKGDREALNRLVKANLRFVISVAKQYQNKGLSLPDLINYGNIGLIKAALKFDETKGFKFISYAVWWIRQSIMQSISSVGRMVRIPSNQQEQINKIKKTYAKFEQELNRTPTSAEIAELLNMTEEKVNTALSVIGHISSLDAPFQDDEEGSLMDVLVQSDASDVDKDLISESLNVDIDRALSNLSKKERYITRLFFGITKNRKEMSLGEIGSLLGITPERVRQIRDRAIYRLKHTYRINRLKTYL